ncbi:putative defense protein 3 isoform 2-T2 [Vipera latastei]
MACGNCFFGAVIAFWTIFGSNRAFPDGASQSACESMLPVHTGAQPQSVPSPYEVSVSTPSFQNGQLVNVQIRGAAYRGLLLEVRSFRSAAALGFWQSPPNNTRFLQCSGNPQGAITHSNTNLKMSQIYSWLPPPSHCPPVVIFVQIQSDLEKSSSHMWSGSTWETVSHCYRNCLLADDFLL